MGSRFVTPTSQCFVKSIRPQFALIPHSQRFNFKHFGVTTTLSFFRRNPFSSQRAQSKSGFTMDASRKAPVQETSIGLDETTKEEEEYTSLSKLLQEFVNISIVDKAWTFKPSNGKHSQAMFSVNQPNLLANKKRRYLISSHIFNDSNGTTSFQFSPFPIEMTGVSTLVPSPSGSKVLVIRNSENESPAKFEVWSQSQVEKEFQIPQSVHGSVYTDGWFEGISWNSSETMVAYVAEEPVPSKPTFDAFGYKKETSTIKDFGSWKGQGDWEEDWGETYAGKRQPALFVIDISSGEIRAVDGISKSLSVGQVIWAPPNNGLQETLVFVGWSSEPRKLGIKYCFCRACSLYAVRFPFSGSEADKPSAEVINLTQSISSACIPHFSPDGKSLVFLSAKTSVDTGAHRATDSLYKIDWPCDGKLDSSLELVNVVPVVMCPEDDSFPGLYDTVISSNPWLSDGSTMIVTSAWRSDEAIIAVNVLSGDVTRVSPDDTHFSWKVLALDGDNIIAVCSSLINVPQIKYGRPLKSLDFSAWSWDDISSPFSKGSEKVMALLAARQFSVMKIPVPNGSENLSRGANKPFEAMFVSSKTNKPGSCDPVIVVLHGGPHTVYLSAFSKSLAFLSSIGYSLLIVNYRGSLGFGEEALLSLPGKVGSQDVNDVLAAIDHVIKKGLIDPSRIAVLGGSHGGFLTTHLIGQAPEKFAAAAARNPVCNLALMTGTTDIPDWCFVESLGVDGKSNFTESPSSEHLSLFLSKSPISHIAKVKTPTIFLLGAKDRRVPVSNGIQYARALKERGVEVKVILFPEDTHGIERPQSDFESFLNIGAWFKKYCK
ncbi:acylamino-acid-releasing enzyme isoform X2 [Impatiens glandulifera]|uniref:acylamino-acid-releasing enzyme isoform X2 n=1 Tax=Impatiens glandulifera TaxID=253017 RepID=UPI001FB16154|nr:acylamino-acid-releasing enzyme isoform X2 [Impatiens glandulifera]